MYISKNSPCSFHLAWRYQPCPLTGEEALECIKDLFSCRDDIWLGCIVLDSILLMLMLPHYFLLFLNWFDDTIMIFILEISIYNADNNNKTYISSTTYIKFENKTNNGWFHLRIFHVFCQYYQDKIIVHHLFGYLYQEMIRNMVHQHDAWILI